LHGFDGGLRAGGLEHFLEHRALGIGGPAIDDDLYHPRLAALDVHGESREGLDRPVSGLGSLLVDGLCRSGDRAGESEGGEESSTRSHGASFDIAAVDGETWLELYRERASACFM